MDPLLITHQGRNTPYARRMRGLGFGLDVGGSGIKGAVVDLAKGKLSTERFKILTPHPSTPDAVASVAAQVVAHFDWHL